MVSKQMRQAIVESDTSEDCLVRMTEKMVDLDLNLSNEAYEELETTDTFGDTLIRSLKKVVH